MNAHNIVEWWWKQRCWGNGTLEIHRYRSKTYTANLTLQLHAQDTHTHTNFML